MATTRSSSPQQHFGAAVRRHREALGFSQERLAQLAGIHRNYAGAVERGERNIALVNMIRIARALGVTLSVLVDGVDTTLPPERTSQRSVAAGHRSASRSKLPKR